MKLSINGFLFISDPNCLIVLSFTQGTFDFYLRNYIGSQVHFNEYTRGTRPINAKNIKERSETILDQYGKTGSLYPHNVVLVPLGDDFMYYEVI